MPSSALDEAAWTVLHIGVLHQAVDPLTLEMVIHQRTSLAVQMFGSKKPQETSSTAGADIYVGKRDCKAQQGLRCLVWGRRIDCL